MAIITRCRMPPDRSCADTAACAVFSSRHNGPEIAAVRPRALLVRRAADAEMQAQRLGDLAANRVDRVKRASCGSWKIMPTCGAPHVAQVARRQGRAGRAVEQDRGPTRCARRRPAAGAADDRAAVLLPEPDSPTSATVWPFSTLNETLSTARNVPSDVLKSTQSLEIFRRC
jgi:hypothetical protein